MKFALSIALILSAAALAMTVYRELEDPVLIPAIPKAVVAKTEPDNGLHEELLKLKLRLAALEKAVANKSREIEPIPRIQEEVAELSTFQNDLAEYTLNIDPLNVIGTTEREIETAYNILMDENQPPMERAKQAALLKRYNLFDQEAVDSMKQLFLTAEDLQQKTAALVALKGYVTPEMRDAVLDAFGADAANGYKNGRLRYHGIEALEPLLPDPEIETLLTVMAQNDPEPKIAGRAARAVGLPVPTKALNTRTVDDSKPATDRADGDG